ncbi:MAG: rRNA pseudouridine synthase [Deltaproteobacteria bacterium]|nr:rRNA pseudouridine synthase [Deltaproteobacteria bacterium]
MKVRINKFIAESGYTSRRKVDDLIAQGRIKVNGRVLREMGVMIDPDVDIVTIDDEVVLPEKEKVYILLNKPPKTICSSYDDRGRRTVIDLVNSKVRVFNVGRLDYDAEGVLLLTNDGELANMLTHPKYQVERIYHVKVKGVISPLKLLELKKGVHLRDGFVKPASIKVIKSTGINTWVEVILKEGKHHEIKRLFEYVGYDVIRIKRVEFAGLRVDDIPVGGYRELSPKEVKRLYAYVMSRTNKNKSKRKD